jgi:thiamine kinase-like enzyme
VGRDRLGRGSLAPNDVPARIEDVTAEWLTATVGRRVPGAVVSGLDLGPGSSGTSVRRQLRLTWNDAGRDGGLPPTLFAKSTPTLMTRIANGLTGTSATEAGFYTHLRPELELEAPVGWHSAFDPTTCRSIHLLEDLTETRGATFCTPTTSVDRTQAGQLVDVLAALHSADASRRIAKGERPEWMRTYAGWWAAGMRVADIERYHAKGFAQAGSVVPAELTADSRSLWEAFGRSVREHDDGPATVIHNDVHLGNWFQTGEGRMGLCDWQCVCVGIGTRDLAYALATALTVEDRRAWEDELVARYADAVDLPLDQVRAQLRSQLPGALMMWTSTLSKPPGLPDMQPKATSLEMIRRITTALADHGY